jgi:hypothetical protein
VAATPEGRRLTEEHRLDQQQVRNEFLAEFIAMWALLDSARLDETGPGWVRAVLRLIAAYRLLSAQVTTRYYWAYRAAELPGEPPPPRIELPPGVSRPQEVLPRPEPPAAPTRRQRPSQRARREPNYRGRRPRGEDVIPNPRNSELRWDLDEDAIRRSLERPATRIEIPDIDWTPRDRAAEVSLNITGPIGQKAKIARGRTQREARDVSFVESSGAATRHVLTGGRQSLLTLLTADPKVHRWIRVTDGDPCGFCAMLASRGPVYLTEDSAGFKAHDHCACTAEAVYHAGAPWPGRAAEFHRLWNQHIKDRYSGKEARRQWRRLIDEMRREARREGIG